MSKGAGQNRVAERVSRYVPFWEVPGSNVRLECGEVFQVNIFWSLMLAPLPHNFVKWKQRVDFFEIADFFFHFTFAYKMQPQTEYELRPEQKPHPSCQHSHTLNGFKSERVSLKNSQLFPHLGLIFMDCFLWYLLYIFRDRFNSLLVALLSKTGNCWVSL